MGRLALDGDWPREAVGREAQPRGNGEPSMGRGGAMQATSSNAQGGTDGAVLHGIRRHAGQSVTRRSPEKVCARCQKASDETEASVCCAVRSAELPVLFTPKI